VWQLVPDLLTLEEPAKEELELIASLPDDLKRINVFYKGTRHRFGGYTSLMWNRGPRWQELGFWHIGRSQVLTRKYGHEEYWHDDLANSLRTNHLDITFQPVFQSFPLSAVQGNRFQTEELKAEPPALPPVWQPVLGLERLGQRAGADPLPEYRPEPAEIQAAQDAPVAEEEPDWLGRLEFADEEPAAPVQEPPAKRASTGKAAKRGKAIGGSLLKADGSSEPSMVGML
jgi:hypothetical protein